MPSLSAMPEGSHLGRKLLSMALKISHFGYFVQDMATGEFTCSREAEIIWGVDPKPGESARDWMVGRVHPDDRQAMLDEQHQAGWISREVSFRIVRPDGELRYIRAVVERELGEDGTTLRAYGLLQDDTERRRAAMALEHSESRFLSLFETSGAGMVLTGPDGRIRFVNTAFARLLGYEPRELLGRSIRDLSPPDTRQAITDMVRGMREGRERSSDLERPYLHRNGSLVWVRLTITIAPTPDGGEEFIGVLQDLSARHRAEELLRDNEDLLNAAQTIGKIGHWVWHVDTRTTEWSPELCRIAGYPPDHAFPPGHRLGRHVHPDDVAAFGQFFATVMSNGLAGSLQFRLVRTDGAIRHVIARASAVHEGPQGPRMIGTVQDITEIRQREDALRRESLKAEAANRAKTLFLANMSHELRTPLNAILGFAQLLSLETRGGLNEDQKDYVASIVRGGEHLLRLINDVLDLSRIDSGHMPLTLTTVDLRPAIEDVLASFAQMAAGRELVMTVADGAGGAVKADQMRLTQVLVNLVSNAIKFNRMGGRVDIGIVEDDRRLRVCVADTGLGIPRERQAEVFQHFNRLGAEARGIEGTGIGLALSKRLIEEMGGTMGFNSEPGARTVFWFDLPRAASPPA